MYADQTLKIVEEKYGLEILSKNDLQKTTRTQVVALNTNQGKYVLKTTYITESRLKFILQIEEFLRKQNVNIPKVIYTNDNHPYFIFEGYPFVLQEWIDGEEFQFTEEDSLQKVGHLLGKMHVRSLGFQPEDSEMIERPSWEEEYQEKLRYMVKWAKRMEKTKNPKKIIIRDSIDFFLTSGKELQNKLTQHPYYAIWKKKPLHECYLSHGDFHTKNILMSRPEWCIIDWEFSKYDFPSRDCMVLIAKMMAYDNRWDSAKFTTFLSSYLSQNPLTHQELSLFFLDCAFPHRFGRFLKRWRYTKMSTKEVQEFIDREKQKTNYMLQRLKELS